MSKDWHIAPDDAAGIGPLAEAELRALIREGKVAASARCWQSDAAARRPLSETEEFRGLFPSAGPAAGEGQAAAAPPEIKYQTRSQRWWATVARRARRAARAIARVGVTADLLLKRRLRRKRREFLYARIGEGICRRGADFADTADFRWLVGRIQEFDEQIAALEAELGKAKALYSGKPKETGTGSFSAKDR